MYKLAIIGALVAALAVPASAASQGTGLHHAQAQPRSAQAQALRRPMLLYAAQARQPKSFGQGIDEAPKCPDAVVILPGRGYGFCGGTLWFRYGKDGGLTRGPAFWRHLPMDRPDDHP